MSKTASELLKRFNNFRITIKQHGGIVGSYLNLYRTDDLKFGDCIGEDKYGNKYFHNKYYFMGRSRWVQFSDSAGMDYDGSQIPAEWHRWLHYISDENPIAKPPTQRKWMIDHKENFSGVPTKEYVPYSTTNPKIEAWDPNRK